MTYRGIIPLACLDLGVCDTICRVVSLVRYGRGPTRALVEDCTGEVEVAVWDSDLAVGEVVKLRVEVGIHNHRRQVTAKRWRALEEGDAAPALGQEVRRYHATRSGWTLTRLDSTWTYRRTLVYPGPHVVVLTAGGYPTQEDADAAMWRASDRLLVRPVEPGERHDGSDAGIDAAAIANARYHFGSSSDVPAGEAREARPTSV